MPRTTPMGRRTCPVAAPLSVACSPSTVYEVQVRATNAEGDGVWSPAVERSTSQNSEPDPPAVTYGLRATGVSQTRIDLSWNAPTDDGGASITGYRIEVSDDGGSNWSDLVANTAQLQPHVRPHRPHRRRHPPLSCFGHQPRQAPALLLQLPPDRRRRLMQRPNAPARCTCISPCPTATGMNQRK